MPRLIILCGIPSIKRDVYAQLLKKDHGYEVISRDAIRDILFGKNCYITNRVEREVTKDFDFKLGKAYLCRLNIVLNGTNCKEEYIDKIIAECPAEYDVELKFFDISLWMAYIDNFWNLILGGRVIPYKIIRELKRNYDKINRLKYKQYAQIT